MHDVSQPDAPAGAATNRSTKAGKFRWFIISLTFIITLVNYMDRSAISYAIEPIKAEFHINSGQFGFIAGAFAIGYMIMVLVGGIMVDLWGAHRVWTGAAILWSACTAIMGLAGSFNALFFFRTLLGLAEGPHFPSLQRVVADWLPAHERARATAIGLSAVPLAQVIGAPLITNLIEGFGWKTMFVILGSLGIAWAVVWWFVYRDYPENSKQISDEELRAIRGDGEIDRSKTGKQMRSHHLGTGKTTWRFMLLDPSLMSNNYAFFCFGYLLFFAITWLPGYLLKSFELNLKEVGWVTTIPWLTAAILLASAGYLSDYLLKKTGSMRVARTRMIWICQIISGLAFIPLLFSHDLTVCVVTLSIGLGFGLMPNAAFYALNTDLAKDRAATSLGLMDFFLAMAGLLAPILTGWLEDVTGGFAAAFGLLIFFSLTSAVVVLLFQKPDQSAAAMNQA